MRQGAPSTADFDPVRKLALRMVACVVLVVALIMGGVCALAYVLAETPVNLEVAKKADVVASSIRASLRQAEVVGIDPARMPGIAERISELRDETPGVAAIEVATGTLVYRAGSPPAQGTQLLSTSAPQPGVTVIVTADQRYAQRVVTELATDFAFILVAVVFVTLELTYAVLGRTLLEPIGRFVRIAKVGPLATTHTARVPSVLKVHLPKFSKLVTQRLDERNSMGERTMKFRADDTLGIDATLRGLRLPFFLLLFAEDLSRGFLPGLSATMTSAFGSISPAVAAGIPLSVFMICVALAQPLLSGWIDRVGGLRILALSAVMASLSHALTGLQTDLVSMSLCRAASGVAWALAFMVVQSEIIQHTSAKTRLPTLGIFVTVIMVSLVCAPQIGGMLADAFGPRLALGVASALCMVALVLTLGQIKSAPTATVASAPPPTTATPPASRNPLWLDLIKNGQFGALILLSAMPAKLLLVGYCFYFAPVAATQAGYSAAMAGRLMMLYGLLMIFCMPLVTIITHRLLGVVKQNAYHLLVSAGMLLSGLAGLLVSSIGGMVGIAVGMALLGIAQALSTTPQATAIQQTTQEEIRIHGSNAVFAYYRLLERTGSALGPLAFGALIAALGSVLAVQSIAWASLASGLVLLGITIVNARASRNSTPHTTR